MSRFLDVDLTCCGWVGLSERLRTSYRPKRTFCLTLTSLRSSWVPAFPWNVVASLAGARFHCKLKLDRALCFTRRKNARIRLFSRSLQDQQSQIVLLLPPFPREMFEFVQQKVDQR